MNGRNVQAADILLLHLWCLPASEIGGARSRTTDKAHLEQKESA